MTQKSAAKDTSPQPLPAKSDIRRLLGILAGSLAVEALIIFAGVRYFAASPSAATAALIESEQGSVGGDNSEGSGAPEKHAAVHPVELPLVEFRVPNGSTGKLMLYDICLLVSVDGKNEEDVKHEIKDREAAIMDKVRAIVARSDPDKLNGVSEPGLETFRRQVKVALNELLKREVIRDVIVPKCIPYRAQ